MTRMDRSAPVAVVGAGTMGGEDRYRPSALLRRIAAAGGDLREK